jgi:hypothetical protein
MLRHYQAHAISPQGCHHGQPDTGIPAGGFDEGVSRRYSPRPFGIDDHLPGRPVFHRAGGIIAFELADQQVGSGIQPGKANQRRVADYFFHRIDVHASNVLEPDPGGKANCPGGRGMELDKIIPDI